LRLLGPCIAGAGCRRELPLFEQPAEILSIFPVRSSGERGAHASSSGWPRDCIASTQASDCAVQHELPSTSPLSTSTSDAPLKILVIDENPIRRAILEAGLRDGGFENITLL